MITTNKMILITLISLFLTSCVSTSFFQVYKTIPTDKMTLKDNQLVYEDENCKVSYDMWSEGGDIGFQFYNKTDKSIYINLEDCFFVLNGASYNYYKNRVFSTSTSSGTTVSRGASVSKSVTGVNFLDLLQTNRISASATIGAISSTGFSVTYNEEKIVCIPSKTSKKIKEYIINETLFRDCDLFKYPSTKQLKSKLFTKAQSPFIFSNRISYIVAKSENIIRIENEFYVSEITNYPESEVIESKYEEFCGQKNMTMTSVFKNNSPDKFFIKYSKGQDTWKH